MKKLLVICAVAAQACTLFAAAPTAAPVKPPFDFKKAPTNEAERVARRLYVQDRIARHTGGKLIRPGTRAGEIVYVNCQKRADKKLLEESAAYFIENAKFNITVKEGTFNFAKPQIQGSVSLFVVDDPSLPGLLVAPEDRWAVVNVAPLAQGRGEKKAFFEARVRKQLTRGFSALCGATNSGYPNALTGGICKPEQLDKHVDARLPVDVIARFAPYLEPFGVTPAVETTYRRACQEGWAPAPTNDYQRAIVEQIKKEKSETLKGPAKPRRIKFDQKKGE